MMVRTTVWTSALLELFTGHFRSRCFALAFSLPSDVEWDFRPEPTGQSKAHLRRDIMAVKRFR